MRSMVWAAALVLAAIGATVSPAQQPDDDIADKIINAPAVEAWSVTGLRTRPPLRKDQAVQGGKALRVAVPGKADQAWAVAAANPIQKPVKAGDEIVLAFWARLEKGEAGATEANLPYNAVQLASAPYTALFTGGATIGPQWKLHSVTGRANKDYKAGELNVSIHLATGKQTIDLGPVFVLDMGPAAK